MLCAIARAGRASVSDSPVGKGAKDGHQRAGLLPLTQWIFLKLYERGLAYRHEAAVQWCPRIKRCSPTSR